MPAPHTSSITIADAQTQLITQFKQAGIVTPELDARILLTHSLNISTESLIAHPERALTASEQEDLEKVASCRCQREPIAHITGLKEFWGHEYCVSPHVLTPRPDSETLIEAVLTHFTDRHLPLNILDLGTGSGCLLLSLLLEYPDAIGLGIDSATQALEVAYINAKRLHLETRSTFALKDWQDGLSGHFDVIITNPPYIPTADIATLEPEVAQYEPHAALDGGPDGLACYRDLAPLLPQLLAANGIAVLELGAGQGGAVSDIMASHSLTVQAMQNDLAAIPRALVVTANEGASPPLKDKINN